MPFLRQGYFHSGLNCSISNNTTPRGNFARAFAEGPFLECVTIFRGKLDHVKRPLLNFCGWIYA